MVSSDAYNGYFTKNPFNFKHYDLSYICLKKNGEEVPFEPLEPVFEGEGINYMQSYMAMFLNLEMYGKNDTLPISYSDFGNGYTLHMYKLTPDLSMLNPNEGPVMVSMKLRFRKKLTENVMLILYSVFNGAVEINEDREAFVTIF